LRFESRGGSSDRKVAVSSRVSTSEMGSIGNGGELTYLEKGVQDAEKFSVRK
jgi:hypothetical protein